MKIDLNKKYRYHNGEPARVLCVDAPGDFPVVAIGQDGDPTTHKEDGKYYDTGEESTDDLIEVREPLECWLWVQQDGKVDYDALPSKYPNERRRLFREVIE